LHREQVVRLEDELAITMMGSKDCCLNNFTLFLIHFDLQHSERFDEESFKLDFGSAILFKSQARFQIFDSSLNQNDSKKDKYG
jgi:hypothetical protein